MKEILYILLDNYAEHEIGFMPGAVSTDATGFRKEPKYINKMVAPTMEPVKSIGGMRTLPDYSFETMPADYAALVLIGGFGWMNPEAEQSMFTWLSRLLHWRQGNETIIRGYQTQFIPYNGIYVITRRWHRNTVMTILNGTSKDAVLEVERYKEILNDGQDITRVKDIPTGRYYDLTKDLKLKPRQSLVLEF